MHLPDTLNTLTDNSVFYFFVFLFKTEQPLILDDLLVKQEVVVLNQDGNVAINVGNLVLNHNNLDLKQSNSLFYGGVLHGFFI